MKTQEMMFLCFVPVEGYQVFCFFQKSLYKGNQGTHCVAVGKIISLPGPSCLSEMEKIGLFIEMAARTK